MMGPHDLLLVVDVQNDFCPGGNLPVADGDQVVPVINRLLPQFRNVVLTQDWHPSDHASFASMHAGKSPYDTISMPYGEQTLWPDHCIQGSEGASFHPDLETDGALAVIRKGMNASIDSYSAFTENDRSTPTGLGGLLGPVPLLIRATQQEVRPVVKRMQLGRSLQEPGGDVVARGQIQATQSERAVQPGPRQVAVACVAGGDTQQLDSRSMVVPPA